MRREIEVIYEGGVFKPLEKVELREGEKVVIEVKDIFLLREKLKKYSGILKMKITSEELDELYHQYLSERSDIP
ncbi:MAG: protein belonging to Uncharacterized protein family UPF0165 [Candidatus Syntrophoarchaeum caldarius]|uniref:Antitoxin n=1 Tax=Candidatus Syntropharchaeum caldarium TaxID=1838285 RepID=A0A1F2PAS9_9EURY|nr:MAG: protein belonging to Uncharacterized protein family UPF0165 [Candidatus Syntrophoarchaeum caldarius]